ncbi:hypothetical protein EDD11_008042 [Mortierella claussenii]|nr:hypothetical protein EDD11_008042 [Mortierella claussenii]
MANPDTFTLFLATETLETITLRQLPQQQQQQQQLEPQGADVSLEGNASSSSSLSTASTATLAGVPKITFKITKIVGCLTLITLTLLMNARAHIEDLVVADTCRGQGVGRGLMQRAINHAVLHRRCKMVDLTSKPDRIEARALYESLGFQIRNTAARCGTPSVHSADLHAVFV